MSNLPQDIIVDILSRLPVKTLLRFRCVSKPWWALIDGPNFIKMHLNQSVINNVDHSLVFSSDNLYASDLDSLDSIVKLNHPLNADAAPAIIGSCNGLLLLLERGESCAIWNMWTRKYHKLPRPPVQWPQDDEYTLYLAFGFGYDSNRDDYKVVRILQFYYEETESFRSDGAVYSLKSNSWKKIKDLPYHVCFGCEMGVYANNALHWVVRKRPSEPIFVVVFDFGTENYSLLPEPEHLEMDFDIDLVTLGGCVCITYYYFGIDLFQIWVLEQYRVTALWTKLAVVKLPNRLIYRFLKPVAYSKGGDEILLNWDGERLAWYHLAQKTFREVTICGVSFQYCVPEIMVVSVGSLVPPGGFGEIGGVKQRKQEKNTERQNRKQRDDFLSKGFKLVL